MIVECDRGWEHVGTPLKFKQEPGKLQFNFARPGEHTKEVLKTLGYDDAAIVAMKEDGAI